MLLRYKLTPLVLLALGCAIVAGQSKPKAAKTEAGPAKTSPAKAAPVKPAPDATAPKPKRRALLVGCSKYDHVKNSDLVGPANDVILFRDLLVDHFEFKDAPITILAEVKEASGRPTKANIKSAFKTLYEEAQLGDDVVILLGGHGFYIPDDEPNESDPEPDGLDECFLPCDTLPFDSSSKTIGNAIRDDELREWITAIRDKGAFVWVICDSCHSGTGLRSTTERAREINTDYLGLPTEIHSQWRSLGEKSRGTADKKAKEHLFDEKHQSGQGQWVALYAAESTQTAPELLLPIEADYEKRRSHGLLTFTIRQVLTQATEPISYSELIQRVQQQYTATRSTGPNPLIEGNALDREVLGKHVWPGRSRLRVKEMPDKTFALNGGTMHGLSKGTILKVKSNRMVDDFVKIVECSALESVVVQCDEKGNPPQQIRMLFTGGTVEITTLDYSYLRPLVVGMDPLDRQIPAPELAQLIKSRGEAQGVFTPGLIRIQDTPDESNWVVRTFESKAYLVPASGWPLVHGEAANPDVAVPGPEFGPFSIEELDELTTNLAKIAKAQNLLRLAPAPDGSKLVSGAVNVHLEIRRLKDLDDPTGTPLDLSQGAPQLEAGELLSFHITNKSRKKVDVTLLFVDSTYGITAWFPHEGEVGNRMGAGETFSWPAIRRARITADTTGLEHMVVLAVEAKGPPTDLTWLAQSGVARSRGDSPTRDLEDLLGFATERDGERGMKSADAGGTAYVLRTITWQVPTPGE